MPVNVNLFFKSLKEIRISWPSYAIGLILYVYLLISIYPSIEQSAEEYQRILRNYPESFLRLFGGGPGSIASAEGFLSLEIFSLIWFIIIGAFVISYGTGAIGKEIESGTIEMLLSQPVTRTRILITKGITLLAGSTGLVIVTMVSTYLFGLSIDLAIKPEGIIALTVIGALFFLAIGSYSLFFSVLLGERGRAAFISAGILAAMYLLTTLGQNADWARRLSVISLFHYYDSVSLLSTGDIPLDSVLVYGGILVFFFIASIVIFNRRDIAP